MWGNSSRVTIHCMTILKPKHLNMGDKIGLVAPSFPFPVDGVGSADYVRQYLDGKSEIEKMGFVLVEGKNLKKSRWWMGGIPQERAEDINLMFANPEIKAIIAHDGGNATIDILEHLDFDLIKNNPKPFIGFSDITTILVELFTKTGLVGFHMGLLSYTLGYVWHKIINNEITLRRGREIYLKVLASTQPVRLLPKFTNWESWRGGKAEGSLFGGNLSMLVSLIGTKYFPPINELRSAILFWEIDNTQSYRIHKGLYQLKYFGVFDVISGMIVGKLPDIKPTGWDALYNPTPREILMDIVKDYTFPILGEVDFGHKNINIPMPIGINTKIDADDLNIEFTESAVV